MNARKNIDGAIEGFQPKEFAQAGIYPNIWMHEDKEELKNSLTELLKKVVKEFAESLEN